MIRLAILAALIATPALCDPCTAIPDKGPMPTWLRKGATFEGPVPYIGDGDSLCVMVGLPPSEWVEVRLADFYAPEIHEAGGLAAKVALERIVRHSQVTCTADHRSYDRIVARCTVDGVSVGDRMRGAGVQEGGRGR